MCILDENIYITINKVSVYRKKSCLKDISNVL